MVSMLEEAVRIREFKIVWKHDKIPGPMSGFCLAMGNLIYIEGFGGNNNAV
jgi:hypothetical protein